MAYHKQPHPTLSEDLLHDLRHAVSRLDIAPGPGGSRMAPFDQSLQVLQPLLADHFSSQPWLQATVVALYPSSQIVAHADSREHCPGIRCHIPIALNDGCWVFHDGHWQQLELGRTYRMDPLKVHGAVNWGPSLRLHVMVDL